MNQLACLHNLSAGASVAALFGWEPLVPYQRAISHLPAEDFLEYRGRKVHVEEHGSGPPLLLLHGFAASSYSFRKLIPGLAACFRVIALDYYGFGYTERPSTNDDFSFAAQLALIRYVMEVKKITSATVLGHSYGGTLALLLAKEDRARVQRLVLVSPVVEFRSPPLWLRIPPLRWAGYLLTRWFLSSPERFRSTLRRAYFQKQLVTPARAEAYRRPLLVSGLARTYFAFTSAMASAKSPDLALPEINIPALIIAGAHDEIVLLTQLRRLANTLPNARLKILSCSGHSAPEEEPDALAEEIMKFINPPEALP